MSHAAGPHRLAHVDAMRAVAVLLVMWTHYAELYGTLAGSQFALDTVQQSVNFGRIGVVIFFGISGMLIPNSLRGAAVDGTRRFVIRRFFRLYPAFWLSLPIGYAVYWLLFGHRMTPAGLVANLTMIPTAFGRDAIMSHYWTLETELYFYALCLALHWLGGLHRMRTLCLVCLGLCAAFVLSSALKLMPADALGQYKGMLYHLAIMFWGACFRQAYDSPRAAVGFRLFGRTASLSHRAAFAAVTAAVAGVAVLMAGIDLLHRDFAHVSASIGYLLGMLAFLVFATVIRIRAQVFAWIGRISYSLYLLHGIPLYLIYAYCRANGLTGGPLGVYMALTVPPALALAWASYRLVETAGIDAGHALTPSNRPPGGGGAGAAPHRNPLDNARPAQAARDEA